MKITAKDVLMAFARAALKRLQQKYPEPTEEEVRQAAQISYGMKRTDRGWLWAVKFGDARIWGEAIDEERAERDGFDAVMRAHDYVIQ